MNAYLVACSSDARMSGKTSQSKAEAAPIPKDAGSNPESSPNTPSDAKIDSSNLISEPEPEAIMPTPIGGAYLVCNSTPDGASCQAFDFQNQPYDMRVERAYLLTGNPVRWTSIDFNSVGMGAWTVKLPAVSGSFGIAFLDKIDQHLSDWIVKADLPPENLALDGSFEGIKIGSLDFAIVTTAADYPWQVSRPSAANVINSCPIVWLEVQSVGTGIPSIDGNQWVELNGFCEEAQNPAIYNVTLTQKIKVEPGHSYEVLFSYRSREAADLEVSFGGSKLVMHSADQTTWKEARILKKVDSAEAELIFTGMTKTTDGGGTLIDKVRVYDLGAGPTK